MSLSKLETLRIPLDVYQPDTRNIYFGHDNEEVQHALIAPLCLSDDVPEKIVVHYETARNLYLYSFNVFRFYMVAQQQALTCLEFAIKERFGKDEIKRFGKRNKCGTGLAACLYYVFDHDLVQSDDFPNAERRRRRSAESEYQWLKHKEMKEKGLIEIELDYDEVDYDGYVYDDDYRDVLRNSLPSFRNDHAHGSSSLYTAHVLAVFEDVSVIINKIFAVSTGQSDGMGEVE